MKYVFFFILLFAPLTVRASVVPTFSISPAKYDLQVSQGQFAEVTIKLTNRSTVAFPVKAVVMDFAPKDDKGALEFGKGLPSRSAKEWLHVKQPDMVVAPDETKTISVQLTPPVSLADGSYFAVVMFQPQMPPNYVDTTTQTTIVPWIGELFLIKVGNPPEVTEHDLRIKSVSFPKLSQKAEIPVTLEIENTSNYHVASQAEFSLLSLRGKYVTKTDEETTVLPGTSRTIQAKLTKKTPIGIYWGTADVRVAGFYKKLSNQPVVVLSKKGIAGIVLVLIALITASVNPKVRQRVRLAWQELIKYSNKNMGKN